MAHAQVGDGDQTVSGHPASGRQVLDPAGSLGFAGVGTEGGPYSQGAWVTLGHQMWKVESWGHVCRDWEGRRETGPGEIWTVALRG